MAKATGFKSTVSGKPVTQAKAPEAKAPKAPPAPKVLKAASEEEIKAAVAGTLKPRDEVGSKSQDSLRSEADNGRPSGRPLGVTTGLPVMLAWCYFFQQNEKAAKKDRLTDEQISAAMKKEFPGRQSAVFDSVAYCRNSYNKGLYTKGGIPRTLSKSYGPDGEPAAPRARKGRKPTVAAPKAKPAAPVAKPPVKKTAPPQDDPEPTPAIPAKKGKLVHA